MESNYWAMVARKRLSRRRAISIVGGTTLGATFLVACSGEDEPEAQSTSPPSPTSSTGSTVGSTPTAADTPVSDRVHQVLLARQLTRLLKQSVVASAR